MISEYDNFERRCPLLGHEIKFQYCRSANLGLPCRKILNCWFERFPVENFLRNHFSKEEIETILKPQKPKLVSLIELIKQSQSSIEKNNLTQLHHN